MFSDEDTLLLQSSRDISERILSVSPSNLIQYLPLLETSGSTATDRSTKNNPGIYSNVTLGEPGIRGGQSCPRFNGPLNPGYVSIYSANLNTNFNPNEGTLLIPAKMFPGSYTSGSAGYLARIGVDGNNFVSLGRAAANNTLVSDYRAGAVVKQLNVGGISDLDWIFPCITWSKSNDRFKFFNRTQIGSTLTGLGNWSGNLASNITCLGVSNNSPSILNPHNGWLAHYALWSIELTPDQVSRISRR